jgi:predicted DNA-binding transcriptional regulator YafY
LLGEAKEAKGSERFVGPGRREKPLRPLAPRVRSSRTRFRRRPTIERSAEVIRQWKILIDVATSADCTIASLAARHEVVERTIRRDLAALESAGFTLYPQRVDGRNCWRLSGKPLKAITETAFTLPELCAFYVNRTQLASSGGAPIEADLASAITKVGKALGPQMKAYLDKLTAVLTCKPDPPRRADAKAHPVTVDCLVKATIDHRRIDMTYHSFASGKIRRYSVEPYRLTFGNGGLYVLAYVPEYGQMRTFAVQRIKALTVTDETFSAVQEVSPAPYGNSLGMYTGGAAEPVEIWFAPKLAPYIEEREWNPSQAIVRQSDGSIVLTMRIAVDVPLRSWVLGFGHQARVLKPSSLAETILEELEEAREQYAPRMSFELPPPIYDDVRQPSLPFRGSRRSRTSARRRSPVGSRA